MENKETIPLNWSGIEIEVILERNYSEIYEKIYGYALSHIEIRSVCPHHAPLPITDTGFRSIFMTEPEMLEHGGAVNLVLSLLEEWAKSKTWNEANEKAKQYRLF